MDQQVTPGQLRKIWASAREIGWTDERLHAELARVIGVSSLRALTYENASLFIDYLVSEGAPSGRSTAAEPPRPNGPRPENPIELATPNSTPVRGRPAAGLGLDPEMSHISSGASRRPRGARRSGRGAKHPRRSSSLRSWRRSA